MQSTGQTSTQALSFTLMHGSAMMYGIRSSHYRAPFEVRSVPSEAIGFCTRIPAMCQAFRLVVAVLSPRTVPLLGLEARVERVTQRVAEEVEREDGQTDREPREDRHPRG